MYFIITTADVVQQDRLQTPESSSQTWVPVTEDTHLADLALRTIEGMFTALGLGLPPTPE